MSAAKQPKQHMTVDEFLAWAEQQPGRYELYAGVAYGMAPERARHGKTKLRVHLALHRAITAAGLACHVMPDGMTVRVDEDTAHEPDALVYCGPEIDDDALEVRNPIILIEVLSPSTRYIDASAKLGGYFSLPSVVHYLIVDPERPRIIHHARRGAEIATRIIADGTILLDPPGLTLDFADIYPPPA